MPSTSSTVLFLLLAACASTRPGSAVANRDVWYSLGDGEQRYGYVRIAAHAAGERETRYTVESRVRLELLGTAQDHSANATLVTDDSIAPSRLDAEVKTHSGTRRIVGRAAADAFVIASDSGAEARSDSIPLAGEPLVFAAALGDWLHRHPGRSRDAALALRLLDHEGVVTRVELRQVGHSADGTKWTLQPADAPAASELRFDREGVLVQQRDRFPILLLQRCDELVARDITQRVVPARELLMFPVDRDLPPLRRMRRLTVRLEWHGIAPDEFVLAASHQRLDSLATESDHHTAVVSLRRSSEPLADAQLPLQSRGFEPQLADDEFLRPSHPRIATKAREIVGDGTSALAAVRELCAWVHGNVRSEMIAETLSGPDVLERGVGKCSEYTTLFGSLARAAGIPTRIVLGLRLVNGTWGGHMWNEAFVGAWIPVDASANEIGGSPALLGFVCSDTIAGTQPLRWKLTESLRVAVVDVEAEPAVAGVTGQDGRAYTDVEAGFRFVLPSAQWRVEDARESGTRMLRLRPPDDAVGDAPMLHLVAFEVPAGTPPKAIATARLATHRKALVDWKVLADEAARVDGAPGHRLDFAGVRRGAGATTTRVTELLWIDGDTGFLFNLIGTDATHARYAADFASVLASFERLQR